MLITHQQLFQNEAKTLASYALKAEESKGRKYREPEDPYRTVWQRDRDRIIHSKAFRRLSGKTQVFVASYGDHYRSRLTHSLEVAQVARGVARALGLNQDLAETIALAHDLGHTPFGHAGEDAMNEIMKKYGDKFEHNEQSRRVVEILEKKSADYPGLNLSFETLEGLMKHRLYHDDKKGPVIHSLEAQLVDVSDLIAYHHHDMDDGLRSGILVYKEMEESLEIWRQVTEDLVYSELGEELYRKIAVTRLISILINDLIEETEKNIKNKKITKPLDKAMAQPIFSFSEKVQNRSESLAEFLGEKFYMHEKVYALAKRGQALIQKLFEIYSKNERLLPEDERKEFHRTPRHIVIKDYIAGMTDEYARNLFDEYKSVI